MMASYQVEEKETKAELDTFSLKKTEQMGWICVKYTSITIECSEPSQTEKRAILIKYTCYWAVEEIKTIF